LWDAAPKTSKKGYTTLSSMNLIFISQNQTLSAALQTNFISNMFTNQTPQTPQAFQTFQNSEDKNLQSNQN
ncbi:144_t:CDS:1, partial [Dentiscutata heterogama]